METLPYSIEIEGNDRILKVDARKYPYLATIEEDPEIMGFIISRIMEDPRITSIEIEQEEVISYHGSSIDYLKEFVELYLKFRDIIPKYYGFLIKSTPFYFEYQKAIKLIEKEFIKHPIKVYVDLKRLLRKLNIICKKNQELSGFSKPLIELLSFFVTEFEKSKVYKIIKDFLVGYKGQRDIYRRLFISDIKPKFVFLKQIFKIDPDAEIVESYKLDKDTEVIIFKKRDEAFYRYYIYSSEYKLTSDEISVLNQAREILMKYQPSASDYLYPEKLRDIYEKISENILLSLIENKNIFKDRLELLKNILIRYTIGFGIIEKLALDEKIIDIYVNPPAGITPITVLHVDYDLCVTNIIPTKRELESWATKLRLLSGRPFDEANPIIDTEIEFNGIRLRVAGVTRPLSSHGLSYVFRRHRERPWTLPLFILNKTLSSIAAAFLSFLVYNGRTILIAGTRGSGKTSLLTSLLLELPRKIRIITIEDTLEIPVMYLKKLGYDVLSLKVKSPFSLQSSELDAESGVRASLRLGDSAIVLGEVRSREAQVLYEAMRVGALSNAVLGTIHAESPYGVFDRVVNDLGTPKTSFKATDIIVMVNPIKSPSGLRKYRRVLRITEVRKHWNEDPLKERGFVDLMIYDPEKDELQMTKDLINGDSDILKSIASRTKFLSKSWERLWGMIEILAEIKKILVDFSLNSGKLDLLEADFVVISNEKTYSLIDESINRFGEIDKDYIINRYKKWLKEKI
ncbi:MAG: type II/IV secretion system ATPase subunit [Nanopusillaceae archaeon]